MQVLQSEKYILSNVYTFKHHARIRDCVTLCLEHLCGCVVVINITIILFLDIIHRPVNKIIALIYHRHKVFDLISINIIYR
jgi:hypothetical protein